MSPRHVHFAAPFQLSNVSRAQIARIAGDRRLQRLVCPARMAIAQAEGASGAGVVMGCSVAAAVNTHATPAPAAAPGLARAISTAAPPTLAATRGTATPSAPVTPASATPARTRGAGGAIARAAPGRRPLALVRQHTPGCCGAALSGALLGVVLRTLPGLGVATGMATLATAPTLVAIVSLGLLGAAAYVALQWAGTATWRRAQAAALGVHASIDRHTRAASPVARNASYGAITGGSLAFALCTVPGATALGVLAGAALGGLAVGGLLELELACRRRWVRLRGGDPAAQRPLDASLSPGVRLGAMVCVGGAVLAGASLSLGTLVGIPSP